MKKICALISVLFITWSCAWTGLEQKTFGIGFILGSPTGISFKTWTSSIGAIQGRLDWSRDRLNIQIGFSKHNFEQINVNKGKMPFYYGLGTRYKLLENNENRLGLAGIFGIEYILETRPVEVFLEFSPVLDIVPSMELGISGGLGLHYYF
jgi:hypothetical protein